MMNPQYLIMPYPAGRRFRADDTPHRAERHDVDEDEEEIDAVSTGNGPTGWFGNALPRADDRQGRVTILGFARDDDPSFENVPLDEDIDTIAGDNLARGASEQGESMVDVAVNPLPSSLPPTFWADPSGEHDRYFDRDSGPVSSPAAGPDLSPYTTLPSNRNDRAGDIALLSPEALAEEANDITDAQMLAATRGDWKKWVFKWIPTALTTAMQTSLSYAFSASTQAMQSVPRNASEIDAAWQSLNATLLDSDAPDAEASHSPGSSVGIYLGYVSALALGAASMTIAYRYLFDGGRKSRRIDAGKYALIATAGALTTTPLLLAPKTAPGILLGNLVEILFEAIGPSNATPKLDVTEADQGSSRTEAWITAGVSGGLSTTVLLIGVPISAALGTQPWVVVPINASIRMLLDLLKPLAQNRLRQRAANRGQAMYVFKEAEEGLTIRREVLDKLATLLSIATPRENGTTDLEAGQDTSEKGLLHSRSIYKGLLPSAVIGQIPRNALSLVLDTEASKALSNNVVLTLRIGAIGGASVLSIAMSAFETQRITAKKIGKKAAEAQLEAQLEAQIEAQASAEPLFNERL